jgi:hypothetical protein
MIENWNLIVGALLFGIVIGLVLGGRPKKEKG